MAMSSSARWNCPMQSRFNFSHCSIWKLTQEPLTSTPVVTCLTKVRVLLLSCSDVCSFCHIATILSLCCTETTGVVGGSLDAGAPPAVSSRFRLDVEFRNTYSTLLSVTCWPTVATFRSGWMCRNSMCMSRFTKISAHWCGKDTSCITCRSNYCLSKHPISVSNQNVSVGLRQETPLDKNFVKLVL